MIKSISGVVCGLRGATLHLCSEDEWECTIKTYKLSDAFLIAQIITASIEIDEITKQDNKAHE